MYFLYSPLNAILNSSSSFNVGTGLSLTFGRQADVSQKCLPNKIIWFVSQERKTHTHTFPSRHIPHTASEMESKLMLLLQQQHQMHSNMFWYWKLHSNGKYAPAQSQISETCVVC